MLPGQVNTKGGVSNLLFGTNIANYAISQFNSAEQAKLKQVGVTVLRIPLTDVSGNTLSDAQLTAMIAGCKAAGAVMLAILTRKNQTYNEHAVQFLGNNCLLYEYSNEPDLNSVTVTQYIALWNAAIPALRKINPKAAFIGPVLGVVANFNSYIVPFLQAAKKAGTLPDAVSFHDYPCTSHPTQAVCQTKTGNIGADATKLQALIKQTIGQTLPIAITEWNVDASASLVAYAKDAAFVTPWCVAALEGMASAGVAIACQFETNSSAYGSWLGAAPLKTEIAKYQAGAVPPAGTGLSALDSVSSTLTSAFSLVFGGQGFTPIPGVKLTLAPTSDVTQLLILLDQSMLLQNPFTENMTAIPQDQIGLPGVAAISITDPFSWIQQFGTNVFYDSIAVVLRVLFLVFGTIVLIKVLSEFIDFQALEDKAVQGAKLALEFGALV